MLGTNAELELDKGNTGNKTRITLHFFVQQVKAVGKSQDGYIVYCIERRRRNNRALRVRRFANMQRLGKYYQSAGCCCNYWDNVSFTDAGLAIKIHQARHICGISNRRLGVKTSATAI